MTGVQTCALPILGRREGAVFLVAGRAGPVFVAVTPVSNIQFKCLEHLAVNLDLNEPIVLGRAQHLEYLPGSQGDCGSVTLPYPECHHPAIKFLRHLFLIPEYRCGYFVLLGKPLGHSCGECFSFTVQWGVEWLPHHVCAWVHVRNVSFPGVHA